jgi:hypothetical protein
MHSWRPSRQWPLLRLVALLWPGLCVGAGSPAVLSAPASASPARHLLCQRPGGVSVGVIHQRGQPLALTAGVAQGARECSTRSTLPPEAVGGGWRFEWHDAVLAEHFVASLTTTAGGGFKVRWAHPAVAQGGVAQPPPPAVVACGPLALPAEVDLNPGDAGCSDHEDRSVALQDAWQVLRDALLQHDPVRFRHMLSPKVMLIEGSAGDSPSVDAAGVAKHLACVGTLSSGGQTFVEWARARPHILVAPTGLDWQAADAVRLAGFGGLDWRQGRWRMTWINASRSVVLRQCPWPSPPRPEWPVSTDSPTPSAPSR